MTPVIPPRYAPTGSNSCHDYDVVSPTSLYRDTSFLVFIAAVIDLQHVFHGRKLASSTKGLQFVKHYRRIFKVPVWRSQLDTRYLGFCDPGRLHFRLPLTVAVPTSYLLAPRPDSHHSAAGCGRESAVKCYPICHHVPHNLVPDQQYILASTEAETCLR